MSRETDKARLFTRRAILVGGVQAGLLAVLSGRLYYLQVLQKDRFSTLAEDNRISVRLLPPSRGQILDHAGVVLAQNQQNYRAVALPERVEQLQALLDKLSTILPLGEPERRRIEKDFKNRSGMNTILLYDNLTWDQVSALSLNMPDLLGVDIEVGKVRTYLYPQMMTHVLGYVGIVSQKDKEAGRVSYSIPGFQIGKAGIERQYDDRLRGQPGTLQLEVNARGRVVRELARQEPTVGHDLRLTIDVGVQKILQKRLEAEKSGAGVVMDIHTGAIHALVSHPSFDPNLFSYGISQKDWDQLNNNPYVPLLNKAVDGLYAPGSTFKIVTALAGLEEGIIDPEEPVFCPGHYELGDHRFHCWKRGGHGNVNFIQAMAGSCDTYFYEMGKRIGIDKLQDMARRLGFGEKTNIDFPHERTGLAPGRAWKKANKNAPWQQGETLITAIGQGYLLATPLQLAVMMARIANGGFAVRPHLLDRDEETPVAVSRGDSLRFKKKNIDLVLKALSAVVNVPGGTAYGSRIMDVGAEMAGKTGTAQVRRISKAERAEGVISNDALPWKERDHALFVGYAPAAAPRFAAAVVVEHGGSGSHTAAPIVRDALRECQRLVAGMPLRELEDKPVVIDPGQPVEIEEAPHDDIGD